MSKWCDSSAVRRVASALALGVFAAGAAPAQDPSAPVRGGPGWQPTRVIYDDARVRVQEVTFLPGEIGVNRIRPFRVMRVLEGGTMLRTYADGGTETIVYKTGDVIVYETEEPFVPKNVGSTDIVFFVVVPKAPKP